MRFSIKCIREERNWRIEVPTRGGAGGVHDVRFLNSLYRTSSPPDGELPQRCESVKWILNAVFKSVQTGEVLELSFK